MESAGINQESGEVYASLVEIREKPWHVWNLWRWKVGMILADLSRFERRNLNYHR